jgi:hypothetical protein
LAVSISIQINFSEWTSIQTNFWKVDIDIYKSGRLLSAWNTLHIILQRGGFGTLWMAFL